ncbi:hypothetical protein V8E54_005210 [Elaphomyces granulatus]
MADYRLPPYKVTRKSLGTSHAGLEFHAPEEPGSLSFRQKVPNDSTSSHSRNRTSSSSALPNLAIHSQYGRPPPHHTLSESAKHIPTRRLSSGTTSTSSTGGNHPPPYSLTSDIHRSSSSRSSHAQLGYVALMRRQKGTVWCDRAQPEDPRLQKKKMDAKQQAYLELHGGVGAGRTVTLSSNKIRHQNGKGPVGYSHSTLVGATVPQRLLANEVGDGEDDHSSEGGVFHRRTGSGRSSMGSISRFPSGYQRPQQGKTPPNENTDIPEAVETPGNASGKLNMAKQSSENSDELEDGFGEFSDMTAPNAAVSAAMRAKRAEELRRRGSVDDRTTSLTGGVKLYIANPDLSD